MVKTHVGGRGMGMTALGACVANGCFVDLTVHA